MLYHDYKYFAGVCDRQREYTPNLQPVTLNKGDVLIIPDHEYKRFEPRVSKSLITARFINSFIKEVTPQDAKQRIKFAAGSHVLFGSAGKGKSTTLRSWLSECASRWLEINEPTKASCPGMFMNEMITFDEAVTALTLVIQDYDVYFAQDVVKYDPKTQKEKMTGNVVQFQDAPIGKGIFDVLGISNYDCFVLDSAKSFAFGSSGAAGAGGVDTGFYNSLSNIANQCLVLDQTLFVTLNPQTERVSEVMFEVLKGGTTSAYDLNKDEWAFRFIDGQGDEKRLSGQGMKEYEALLKLGANINEALQEASPELSTPLESGIIKYASDEDVYGIANNFLRGK